jgi:hypothetical protein
MRQTGVVRHFEAGPAAMSLPLMALFCICTYRIAVLERRRGWIWVAINIGIALLLSQLFASAYVSAALSWVLTFALMAYVISRWPVKKGPFLS